MFNKISSLLGSQINKFAVEPTQKLKVTGIALVTLLSVAVSSCKKDAAENTAFDNRSTAAADYPTTGLAVVPVSADITASTTWTAGNVYELNGLITVRDGATLTIQPGTYIKSSVNTAGVANGVLIIAKDGIINAVGTAASPIVFTSRYLLDNDNSTVGHPGDFGGVIILGGAQINTAGGDALIEGLPNESKYHYGSAGTEGNVGDTRNFKYVRIEYAGYKLAENIEVNGLTLGGVGSGTAVDHVQTSYGLDDGFEFFGGKVNASFLVALGNDDDQFDFDAGYTGTITRALAIADKNSTHSQSGANSDSNGMEVDNSAVNPALTPMTKPVLSFFTISGTIDNAVTAPGYKNGIFIRRGGAITLTNSIVTGYPNGIVIDASATAASSTIVSNSVHGFTLAISPAIANNTTATGAPANAFTINQPFFNTAGFDFLGTATPLRGGVTTTPRWTDSWAKFAY